jgi:hypothetical protein
MARQVLGDNDKNRRLRHDSVTGDPTAADALHGDYSRKQLIEMDAEFRERLAQALRDGDETANDRHRGGR